MRGHDTIRQRSRVLPSRRAPARANQVTVPGTDLQLSNTQAAIVGGGTLLLLVLLLSGGGNGAPQVTIS